MKLLFPPQVVTFVPLVLGLATACFGQPASPPIESGVLTSPAASPSPSPAARQAPSPSPAVPGAGPAGSGAVPRLSPSPSPTNVFDGATAERAAREYYALLAAGKSEEARDLLSPTARERNSLDDVAEVAAGLRDVSVLSVEELEVSTTRALFQITLSVTLRPDAISPYQDGRNSRFVELIPTQRGWRVNRVTTTPIE